MKRQILMRIQDDNQGLITRSISSSDNDVVLINSIELSRKYDEEPAPTVRITTDENIDHTN